MPITPEQARAEMSRRQSVTGVTNVTGVTGGLTRQQARDELERRQLANPPGQAQAEEPGLMSRIGSTLYNASPLPLIDDVKDIAQQGVERTESFPYFRLPDSVGERHEEMSEAARSMAPFAVAGPAGPVAAGIRGGLTRAAGAGAGQAVADAGQQALGEGSIDPRQVATAAALGGAGQGVGELAGAAIPAAVRGLMRGGEKGRQGVQQAITDAAAVGEVPTVAQATKNSFLDGLEQTLTKIPGSAGRLRDHVAKTTSNVRQGLERIAQKGVKGDLDAESAGRAVIGGVDEFVGRFKTKAAPLFDKITDRVGADTPASAQNTLQALQGLTTPIKGAEKTSQRFVSPFIRGLAEDVASDAAEAGGQLPFQALQRVRSLVGEKLTNPGLTSDVPTAQLKKIYGAISNDIEAAATASGGEAAQAFKRANSFYRSGMSRIENTLDPLVKNKVPEKVFQSLVTGARSGPTQIRTLYRSLNPDQQDVVTGAIIRRMGTAPAGQQGADGAEFSFSTFLTRWNQVDDAAKNAIFKRGRNAQMGQDINAIARYSERVKEASRAFFNPSGTSGATISSAAALFAGGSVLASPVLGSGALTVPLILGLGAGGSNVAARLMTSPRVVKWLAQATKLKPQGIPAHVGRLGAIAKKEDPEVQEAIFGYLDGLQKPIESEQNGQTGQPPAEPPQAQQGGDPGGVAELATLLKAQGEQGQAQHQALMEALSRAPAAQTLKIETPGVHPAPMAPQDQGNRPGMPEAELDRIQQLEQSQMAAMQQMEEMTALNQQMQANFAQQMEAFQRRAPSEPAAVAPTDGPSGAPKVVRRRAAARRDEGGNLIGVDIEDEDETGNRRRRNATIMRDEAGRFSGLTAE